jgi:hypothetical protein
MDTLKNFRQLLCRTCPVICPTSRGLEATAKRSRSRLATSKHSRFTPGNLDDEFLVKPMPENIILRSSVPFDLAQRLPHDYDQAAGYELGICASPSCPTYQSHGIDMVRGVI